jgi:hypothetical protein
VSTDIHNSWSSPKLPAGSPTCQFTNKASLSPLPFVVRLSFRNRSPHYQQQGCVVCRRYIRYVLNNLTIQRPLSPRLNTLLSQGAELGCSCRRKKKPPSFPRTSLLFNQSKPLISPSPPQLHIPRHANLLTQQFHLLLLTA